MLVVLPIFPIAAPLEAVFGEELVAQVLMVDFVGEIRFPI